VGWFAADLSDGAAAAMAAIGPRDLVLAGRCRAGAAILLSLEVC
jgi:hypothetical protein